MKLHLGCGQKYLNGYVNVDYPLTEHSVQVESVADVHQDITTLRYPRGTVDEIRLHHVFEHFTRPVACALVAAWRSWLKPQGILHIEVPDFERTARVILKRFASFKQRAVAERHIFGSHEAQWAIHCHGYTPKTMATLLNSYGFKPIETKKTEWLGTYNLEMRAQRGDKEFSKDELLGVTRKLLSNYLVDDSSSELRLLEIWLRIYDEQLEKCWAHDS